MARVNNVCGADCAKSGGGDILAKARAILCVAPPKLKIMGSKEVFGLGILGRPYDVGILG